MVKDLPDYTREMIIKYTGGFIGLEELATRLGFAGPWDLRGNAVLIEDFESELGDWWDESDPDSSATRSSERKFSGDWSVKLDNGGVSSVEHAAIARRLAYEGLVKYALFCRLAWKEDLQEVYVDFDIFTGSSRYGPQVIYNLPNKTLSVVTTGGAEQVVATALDVEAVDYIWYPILVTFDLRTGYYGKLYFSGQEYDISDIAIPSEVYTAPPLIAIEITSVSTQVVPFVTYLDTVVLTKNTP